MKVQLEHILQNLFQKPSLEEVAVEKLEQMVKEHPYFGTGHFLLAQKLKHSGEDGQQSQRAALYFNDPLWMHWQLKQFSNGNVVEEPVEEVEPLEEEEPLTPEEELAVETIGPVEEAIPAEPETELETETEPEIEEPAEQEQEVETEEPLEQEHSVEYNSPADETPSFHEPEESPAPLVSQEAQPHVIEDPVIEQTSATEDPKPSEPSQPVIQREEPAPLAFDAYYTIDYFASQGIKASAEVQPGDKLGKQLKSFTEWLKTMRRLPQAQVETVTDESEQQHIQQVAANSLEQKEVVTETMAEVLAKQGKNPEAIAIYEKLSLLDPSKSAYFAAKIENLKAN